jgi:hypothetical protein
VLPIKASNAIVAAHHSFDPHALTLEQLDRMDEPGRSLPDVAIKELDQHARGGRSWVEGEEGRRDRDPQLPRDLVGDHLRPDLLGPAAGRFLEKVAMTTDQKRMGRRLRTDHDALGFRALRTDGKVFVGRPSGDRHHIAGRLGKSMVYRHRTAPSPRSPPRCDPVLI